MPYMKLTSPEVLSRRAEIARELTETVVRLMTPRHARGIRPEELRERCTVHFTPYDPSSMAMGGRLMRDRVEEDVTMEFSDWGMGPPIQRRLARELTPILARLFGMQSRLDHVNIRFHPYPRQTSRSVASCSRILSRRSVV